MIFIRKMVVFIKIFASVKAVILLSNI